MQPGQCGAEGIGALFTQGAPLLCVGVKCASSASCFATL